MLLLAYRLINAKAKRNSIYEGSIELRHIGFVKIMRANPSLITELSDLKQRLNAKYPLDKDSHQKEKVDFYNEIHKML